MSVGTLYIKNTFRKIAPLAIAKHLGLDINVQEPDAKFAELFPVKKIPAFVAADGFTVHELLAVSVYLASLKESTLLGSTKEDYASVLKWASFSNQDVWQAIRAAVFPITGRYPYNKKAVDAGIAEAETYANVLEKYLTHHTYLVGERVTVADFVAVSVLARGFDTIWGAEFIKTHPALTRYVSTLTKQEALAEHFTNFEFREEPIKYTPPKKEEKPKAAPQAAAPKKAAPAAEEPAKEKKEVHPLSLLPKSEFVLDEWKRVYSNEETRETALPWFWKNYKPEEWSLWKVAYKYNDELTLTFMSNNLVGGFFNRLSGSTKYMFGCAVVAGENNDNGIVGAFLVRGQEFAPAFDVAPDWESYDYTKLDVSKPEDKTFVEDIWSWDKPVEIDGKIKEVADGKVLK